MLVHEPLKGFHPFYTTTGRDVVLAMWATLLMLLVVAPIFQVTYPLVYRIGIALAAVLVLPHGSTLYIFTTRKLWPILVCLAIYGAYFAVGHATQSHFMTYVRGVIMFVCGVRLCRDPRRFGILITTACTAFLLLALYMQGGQLIAALHYSNRIVFAIAAANNMGVTNAAFISMITSFVSYVSFASILLFARLDIESGLARGVAVGIFLLNLLFCMGSMWTAPVLVMIGGVGCVGYIVATQPRSKSAFTRKTKLFVSVLLLTVVIAVVLGVSSRFTEGEGEVRAARMFTIFTKLIFGIGSYRDWNEATSGRLDQFAAGIQGFNMSPFIGVGGSEEIDFTTSSGHASILDAFSQYGLLGGIPVAFLLIYYPIIAVRATRKELDCPWTMSACAGMLVVFFLSSFLNPVFMTASSELVFFLAAGFASGRSNQLRTVTNKRRSANSSGSFASVRR